MQFDTDEIRLLFESFSGKTEPFFNEFFETMISRQNDFLNSFEHICKGLENSLIAGAESYDRSEAIKKFHEELLGHILKSKAGLENEPLKALPEKLNAIAGELLAGIPETIVLREKVAKFAYVKSDPATLRMKKSLLNKGIAVKLASRKAKVSLRNLFKMNQIDPACYRFRKIPFRNMAFDFMVNHFMMNLLDEVSKLNKSESENLLKLWQLNEQLDKRIEKFISEEGKGSSDLGIPGDFFEGMRHSISGLNDSYETALNQVVMKTFGEFGLAYMKVDKADLAARTFNPAGMKRKQDAAAKNIDQIRTRWKNAHLALFDDWAVDVEISLLHYSILVAFRKESDAVQAFINAQLNPSFELIDNFIQHSIGQLSQSETSTKKLKDTLISERKKVEVELIDSILTRNIELLTGCFVDEIDAFMKAILELVSNIADKRAFVKNKKYTQPIRTSEINWISPRVLLNFEALPHLAESLNKVKSVIEDHLEKARMNLLLLGTVCDFSLESALLMLDQKKGKPKDAAQVAQEGLDRATNHLTIVRKIIVETIETLGTEIIHAVATFNSEIQKLKNTENLIDLNVKIARIRATEKSRQMRRESVMRYKQLLPGVVQKSKMLNSTIRQKVSEYSIRFGFTSPRKFATFELAEFTEHTRIALEKLPFVYQRLYQISPTDEERFFVNRISEIEQFNQSFANWTKGRFITTAVIGGKGSGITSLINYFLRNSAGDVKIIRHTLTQKVYQKEQYFELFGQVLGQDKFASNQQIVDHLNSLTGRQIIVIENLQHLYLRRIGGFDCMNMFFDLMSNTIKKVFWIGAFTNFSWNYLNNTVRISNFFTDEIYLEPLSHITIEEIIFKRNRLSGYQVIFEPDAQNLLNKAYKQMNDEQRQAFLRKQYFSGLRKLTNGNISLSQLFWLRSTISVNEQAITIGALNDLDFTFVKNLTDTDLFVMQTIVQHDGLTLEEFALVMDKTPEACRNLLIPMLEKGLLIKPRTKFNIHPIIFKPVTDYLSSRNFIH